ncbi:MAG TPA: C40 family peptidase [Woeseiaceae bacterium]|nr:C40 family peptidase [Woeseiaceae bacterium]
MLGLFAGCASAPPQPSERQASNRTGSAPTQQRTKVGERAAAVALSQVGVPYRYGGSGTSGFDCSGLIQYAYRQAGKSVPRTTGQLWAATATVDMNQLQEGDLLFFKVAGKMSHVGLYLGEHRFVHAPSSGRTVAVESLKSPFYAAALLRAGRP